MAGGEGIDHHLARTARLCRRAPALFHPGGTHGSASGPFALRDRYLQPIAALFDRIETLPIPVIAAINGFALGGGCEMSLACDFRLMADHTKIGVPEVRIGALAGAGGVQKLHRLVGRGKALEWICWAAMSRPLKRRPMDC